MEQKLKNTRENKKTEIKDEILSTLTRTPLFEREIHEILGYCKDSLINKQKICNFEVGETFKIGNYEFITLESGMHAKGVPVILKDLLLENEPFSSPHSWWNGNCYTDSHADNVCESFADEISAIIGNEKLIEHTVDLTSDDGLKDYGRIKRRMSLLTTELYRNYTHVLDKHKLYKWWWLATAHSTPTRNDSEWVKCVSPNGIISRDKHYNRFGKHNGIRPYCILKSDVYVSKIFE